MKYCDLLFLHPTEFNENSDPDNSLEGKSVNLKAACSSTGSLLYDDTSNTSAAQVFHPLQKGN